MPQPSSIGATAEELISLYRIAEAEILRRFGEIATAPNRGSEARRLRALADQVDEQLRVLEEASRTWTRSRLSSVYQLGSEMAAGVLDDDFVWTQIHVEAVRALATDLFDQVLAATRYVSADTKRFLRDEGRRQTALSLIEGRTPQQAARILADAAAGDRGILTIRYANGARHSIADYADTLLRTATANAFNSGTLLESQRQGVEFAEIFDGADCCLGPGHLNGPLANGLILPIDEAMSVSISHPRCARSWSPKPSVKTAGEAKRAQRFTDAEQQRLAMEERARAAEQKVKFSVEQQVRRSNRRPRTPRTPRKTSA